MKVTSALLQKLSAQSLLIALLLGSVVGEAKDLSHRFGLGATNIQINAVPALSLDWELSNATAFEFNVALDTSTTAGSSLFAVRYARNLYIEDFQSYFVYLGAGLESQTVASVGQSGFMIESGVGAKYFFTGLPNLGFSFGAGFQLDSGGGTRIRTAYHGGIHYYF